MISFFRHFPLVVPVPASLEFYLPGKLHYDPYSNNWIVDVALCKPLEIPTWITNWNILLINGCVCTYAYTILISKSYKKYYLWVLDHVTKTGFVACDRIVELEKIVKLQTISILPHTCTFPYKACVGDSIALHNVCKKQLVLINQSP